METKSFEDIDNLPIIYRHVTFKSEVDDCMMFIVAVDADETFCLPRVKWSITSTLNLFCLLNRTFDNLKLLYNIVVVLYQTNKKQ